MKQQRDLDFPEPFPRDPEEARAEVMLLLYRSVVTKTGKSVGATATAQTRRDLRSMYSPIPKCKKTTAITLDGSR